MNKLFLVTRVIPSRLYLQLMFLKHFGRFIDFKNPKSFNEKLQVLKLKSQNPEYTIMVDKYRVKQYVADIIGEGYIIPTLEVWDNPQKIDISMLPNQFVLKCNNDSGGIAICKNKKEFDIEKAKKIISNRLKNNGFWYGREWPYKNVVPCILAEKYMQDTEADGLTDYKLHVFNGKVKFILVCRDRYSKGGMSETFYDTDWNILPFKRPGQITDESSSVRPKEMDKMIELAEKLSKDIPFLRVDFYLVNHQIYFGELTFYPGSGFKKFEPYEWDYKLGSWLHL